MIAAGAYLRALRTDRKLSQGKVAELIGVAGNTIWRIEAGRQEPETATISALLAVLGGRLEDVRLLLNDPAATADDGARLAAAVNAVPDEDLSDVLRLFRELRKDPRRLDRWMGYGERLREEQGD